MGSYRSKLDITADMLRVVDNGSAKRTQIMYQANLNHKLLTKYLAKVLEACLIRFDRRTRCYSLTSKGKKFLEKYKKYSRRNKRLEKRLNDLDNSKKVLEELFSGE